MSNTLMRDIYNLSPIAAPKQWTELTEKHPEFLEIGRQTPGQMRPSLLDREKRINFLIRSIHRDKYQSDMDRTGLADFWQPNRKGDCEDKALYFMQRLSELHPELKSFMRLGICELRGGTVHAIAILESQTRDMVADPTLSNFMIDWQRYPVKRWIMRQAHGHLWQQFSEKATGEKHEQIS